MKTDKAIALLAIGMVAAYVLWRLQEAKGGTVTFVNPFNALAPGSPSTVGSDGTGATTSSLSSLFQTIGNAFKLPGNQTSQAVAPSSPGTSVDPAGPPSSPTGTAQPQGPSALLMSGNPEYLPNLGDPNFSAWNYLATTPPDLAWGLTASGGAYV